MYGTLIWRGWSHHGATGACVAASFLFLLPTIRALSNQIFTENAQALLLARQIKSSGTDVARSLELLQGFTNVPISETEPRKPSAVHNFEHYEAIYLEVLAVVSRANGNIINASPMESRLYDIPATFHQSTFNELLCVYMSNVLPMPVVHEPYLFATMVPTMIRWRSNR
jgi:hypothetical protein